MPSTTTPQGRHRRVLRRRVPAQAGGVVADAGGVRRRHATPRRARVAHVARRLVVFTVLAAVTTVAMTAARVWWVARLDQRPLADVILVLGASQYDGRPSPVLLARLEAALALYQEGVAPRVITVGGKQPGDRFTEADTGRRWLLAQDVAPQSVVAVPVGRDTLQSVDAVAAEIRRHGWHRTVIVTDPWHALRARATARAAGLAAWVSPARTGPAVRSRTTEFLYIGRETAAYLYWFVFRRSSGFGLGVI